MRKLILLLLFAVPFCVKAQIHDVSSLSSSTDPLYIVDGKNVSKKELKAVDPEKISEVIILKDATAAALYGAAGAYGVVEVVTKSFAIKSYQEKLGFFSDDYESYLTSHSTDDNAFIYVIDGRVLAKDKNETNTLYHLNKDKIETVVFTQNEREGSKILAHVNITTKK